MFICGIICGAKMKERSLNSKITSKPPLQEDSGDVKVVVYEEIDMTSVGIKTTENEAYGVATKQRK